eukprot:COSAG01_NODE_2968_length_6788_cov_4.595904_8_plen_61_part_00
MQVPPTMLHVFRGAPSPCSHCSINGTAMVASTGRALGIMVPSRRPLSARRPLSGAMLSQS